MRFLLACIITFSSALYAISTCTDPLYLLLEKRQNSLSTAILNLFDQYELKEFTENNKNWSSAINQLCHKSDCECQIDQYQQRNIELSQKLLKAKAQVNTKFIKFSGQDMECGFNKTFPANMQIFAAGGNVGERTQYRIGEKGENASIFRVIVNSPKQPVALMLGTYDAAIWDISWTEGTKVEAVFVMGHHEQAVVGLPKTIPSIVKNTRCHNFSIEERTVDQINPLSNKLFKKNTDKVYFANYGALNLGEQLNDGVLLLTSLDTSIESIHRADAPLRGDEALKDAVSKGILRKLTQSDIDRWLHMIEKPTTSPPIIGLVNKPTKRYFDYQLNRGYVILKPFTFPEDLHGAHSATFFLDNGVPTPLGDMGHSSLHDFNTGQCKGHSCIQK